MNYNQAFAISGVGMDIERMRVDVAARNLANLHTLVSADGTGYQPLHVVVRSAEQPQFNALVAHGLGAMPVMTVEPTFTSPRIVHQPDHPMADERGFIAYPGIDNATEMMTVMTAMRAYEANVAAMNAARSMALKALDIGGNA